MRADVGTVRGLDSPVRHAHGGAGSDYRPHLDRPLESLTDRDTDMRTACMAAGQHHSADRVRVHTGRANPLTLCGMHAQGDTGTLTMATATEMGQQMTKVKRVTLRGVSDAWRACEPFNANDTLRGEYVEWPDSGRLSDYERSRLEEWAFMARTNPAARGLFVVKSYATPIAWAIVYNDGQTERYKVAQRFSVTTSRHAGRLY